MSQKEPKPTLSALLVTICGSIALSLLGLWAVARWVPPEILANTNDVVDGYLQTVGTVYAVLLAFVVYVVWSQHNEAAGFVDRESNNIFDLFRIFSALPEPTRTQSLAKLQAYTQAIVASEWPMMGLGRHCDTSRNLLEEVWEVIATIQPDSDRDSALYAEILSRFNDLSDTRADRLRASRTRIPSVLWMLLVSGAIIVVGSMSLYTVPHFGPHAVMTAALTGVIAHILYLIYDLDNCFYGYWQVTTEPYQHVRDRMDEVLCPAAKSA